MKKGISKGKKCSNNQLNMAQGFEEKKVIINSSFGEENKMIPFTFASLWLFPVSPKQLALCWRKKPNQKYMNALGHGFLSEKKNGSTQLISPAKHPLERLLNEAGQTHVKVKFFTWHKMLVIKKRTCTETAETKHIATSIQA